jgi:hypothetical protein
VNHARRRERHLRHGLADLPGQEPEVVDEDRLVEVQRLTDGEPAAMNSPVPSSLRNFTTISSSVRVTPPSW